MIDQIIFIGFLVLCIVFGLFSGRNITSLKDYAVGKGDFSTAAISATIIATYISGSGFFSDLMRTYDDGLYYIWSSLGAAILVFLSLAYIFVPRMEEFLGKVSIGDAMGSLFGNEVRIITAIAGFLGSAGFIAMQLKVSGVLFEQALGITPMLGIVIVGLIVTGYSAIGGIKAVTFTDIIQMFTFGTVIPIIIYCIIIPMSNNYEIFNTLHNNPLYNVKDVFNFSNTKSLNYLSFFLVAGIPCFNPTIFQRIAMAKDINQAKNSHVIACLVCALVIILSCAIGFLVLVNNPHLKGNEVLQYIITHYSQTSLKGLILIGVMAMVMSTIDSKINASSVLFVHDFCKPLNLNITNDELLSTRITSFFIGTIAIIFVCLNNDIVKLFILANTFFVPVVTPPFMLAIFGFRPHKYCVLTGMFAGGIGTAIWEFGVPNSSIASLLPGMLFNFVFLVSSHYILKYFINLPGGWVKIPKAKIIITEPETYNTMSSFINLRLNKLLHSPTINDSLYFLLGLYCLCSTIFNIVTVPRELFGKYHYLKYIYFSLVFCSTVIAMYPLWNAGTKLKLAISTLWYFSMFYILVGVTTFLMLLTDFSAPQVYFFVLNICLITLTTSWRATLMMLLPGTYIAFKVYSLVDNGMTINIQPMHQVALSAMVLFSASIVILFKPKDQELALANAKVSHLANRVGVQTVELRQAMNIKNQFINNITHEHHAPMTGVISTSQTLYESYAKLSEEDRISAIKTIHDSAIKLSSLENNLELLQKLANPGLKLNIELFNLTQLINKCFYICYKLYIPNEEEGKRNFILSIQDNIYVEADEDYLENVINNLIINAITYCTFGKITIQLSQETNKIMFSIIDTGIGIPKSELKTIFDEFIVSSRTASKAGGRGIGLSVCKKIIVAHHGNIWAENNFNNTTFSFTIPTNQG